jgi:hypothetical protein
MVAMKRPLAGLVAATLVLVMTAGPVAAACGGWAASSARMACCAHDDCDGAVIRACCAGGESRQHAERVTVQVPASRPADVTRERFQLPPVASIPSFALRPAAVRPDTYLRLSVLLI